MAGFVAAVGVSVDVVVCRVGFVDDRFVGACRRLGEEARQKAAVEKKLMEEEVRLLVEEEAKRSKLLEEERLADLEKQQLAEEAERNKVTYGLEYLSILVSGL